MLLDSCAEATERDQVTGKWVAPAMANQEPDGTIRIQKGMLIHWLDADDEVPRGDLGWVVDSRGFDHDLVCMFPALRGTRNVAPDKVGVSKISALNHLHPDPELVALFL